MEPNQDDPEVNALARELVELTGTSGSEALLEAQECLSSKGRSGRSKEGLLRWLREEVWPHIPPDERGRRLTREEEDEILGYGSHGV